jgi:hypothetical protein
MSRDLECWMRRHDEFPWVCGPPIGMKVHF